MLVGEPEICGKARKEKCAQDPDRLCPFCLFVYPIMQTNYVTRIHFIYEILNGILIFKLMECPLILNYFIL